MWTLGGIVVFPSFSFLLVVILFLWALLPRGIISVFSMLNFVPDALHHLSRMVWRLSIELFLERNTVVSSAKSLIFR